MNREIKFRAWHKVEKRFVFAELLPQNGWCIEEDNLAFSKLKDWQQDTGLKDKNGKEIYEGDIVQRGGIVKEVKWKSARQVGFNVQADSSRGWSLPIKVIGNIYQNKDLLV